MSKVCYTRGGHPVPFLVDDEDLEKVSRYSWNLNSTGHIRGTVDGSFIYLHRYLMGALPGQYVDHINGIRTDCTKTNLRICTNSQNAMNQLGHRDNKLGIRGVIRTRQGTYQGYITVNRKTTRKNFDTVEEATDWRLEMEKRMFGEYGGSNRG